MEANRPSWRLTVNTTVVSLIPARENELFSYHSSSFVRQNLALISAILRTVYKIQAESDQSTFRLYVMTSSFLNRVRY